ncbi:hypothetical protein [uncultured Sunxiuqinia sp.]|uniref:hypothetical protein n=1 Tax=uncultured Sunxiuqinia sp. TaxID=1573825 RepID=UPI002621D813|nr:hypothetical protein [uncultured Sunxiuqinia sp.]
MILDYNSLGELSFNSEAESTLNGFLLFVDLLELTLEKKNPDVQHLCFKLISCFEKLFTLSNKEQFYWDYCPSVVYTETYGKRLGKFLEENLELSESDFLEIEKEKILKNIRPDGFYLSYSVINKGASLPSKHSMNIDFLNHSQFSNIKAATKKKLSFLSEKLGYEIIKPEIEYCYLEDKLKDGFNKAHKDEHIGLTPPEKFVMLHELGIIDFLKGRVTVGCSEKRLAALISKFTDIDAENLRKMMNDTKNGKQNNKINDTARGEFNRILSELKIDPAFFKPKE